MPMFKRCDRCSETFIADSASMKICPICNARGINPPGQKVRRNIQTPPDKLTLDARKADAAGKSYGRWRFEESERRRKAEEIIHKQCEEHKRKEKKHVDESAPDPD